MAAEASQMGAENSEARTDVQADRDLFKATLPFGVESVKTSWWVVGSTFLLLLASLFGAALAPSCLTFVSQAALDDDLPRRLGADVHPHQPLLPGGDPAQHRWQDQRRERHAAEGR